MYYSMYSAVCDAVRECHRLFHEMDAHPLALTRERDGTVDTALMVRNRVLLVRNVLRARGADHTDLVAILKSGTFDRAVLVYCRNGGEVAATHPAIQSYWMGQIERLVASLTADVVA